MHQCPAVLAEVAVCDPGGVPGELRDKAYTVPNAAAPAAMAPILISNERV